MSNSKGKATTDQTNYFSWTFGLEAVTPKREAKKPEKSTQSSTKSTQEAITATAIVPEQEKCKYKILEAFPITII